MKTLEEMAVEFSKFDSATDIGTDLGSYRQGLFEGFLAGYKAAQQWISVKDRLPEEGQDCLFYVDWIDVWEKGSERITYQEIGVFNGKDRFYHRAHTDLKDVTHWMPLPEAPKEEK